MSDTFWGVEQKLGDVSSSIADNKAALEDIDVSIGGLTEAVNDLNKTLSRFAALYSERG